MLLLSIGVGLLVTLVKQDDIKNKISKVVYANTGRKLTINGELAWSFFPWVGVKIEDVVLSNPSGFKANNFAHVGEIGVSVQLVPLFMGHIQTGRIILKDFDLNLIKNVSGTTNWQDLTAAKADDEQKANGVPAAVSGITIADVSVINGHVLWQDQQLGKKIEIDHLNLRSKDIGFSDPFVIVADCDFSNAEPKTVGRLALSAELTLNLADKFYALHNLQLSGDLQSAALTRPVDFDGSADVIVDLAKQTLDANNLRVRVANLNAVGIANGVNILDAPKFNGGLTIANFDAQDFLQTLGLKADSSVWQNASFKVVFETTSKFLKLPSIEGNLGDMNLRGSGSYTHFGDKIVVFDLALNKLDTNNLSMQATAKTAKPVVIKTKKKYASKENTLAAKQESSILDVLRAIKLNGNLQINDLRLGKLALNNFYLQLDSDYGMVNLSQISFKGYDGIISSSANVDLRKNTPRISAKLAANHVSLQPLFKDLAGFDKFSGSLALDANITTNGDNDKDILRNLNGTSRVVVNTGVYQGIDVPFQLRRALSLVNQKISIEKDSGKTTFDSLLANFKIINGVLSNNDLVMRAQEYKVTGSGTANLINQMLDFKLVARAIHEENIILPINIKGAFSSPSVLPDINQLLKHATSQAVKVKAKQVIESLPVAGAASQIVNLLPIDKILK